jgi:hypothetical protein
MMTMQRLFPDSSLSFWELPQENALAAINKGNGSTVPTMYTLFCPCYATATEALMDALKKMVDWTEKNVFAAVLEHLEGPLTKLYQAQGGVGEFKLQSKQYVLRTKTGLGRSMTRLEMELRPLSYSQHAHKVSVMVVLCSTMFDCAFSSYDFTDTHVVCRTRFRHHTDPSTKCRAL